MSLAIVGRESELSSLRTFIEQDEGGPTALLLDGEPGIGKSTVVASLVPAGATRRIDEPDPGNCHF